MIGVQFVICEEQMAVVMQKADHLWSYLYKRVAQTRHACHSIEQEPRERIR
jgi:hypothetical protein